MSHGISMFERVIVTIHSHNRTHLHSPDHSGIDTRFWSSQRLGRTNKRFRSEVFTRIIRTRLFGYLQPEDLRNLRATSRVLCRVVQERIAAMFHTVYVRASDAGNRVRWESLELVADSVMHLVVVIGDPNSQDWREVSSSMLLGTPATGNGKEMEGQTMLSASIQPQSEHYGATGPIPTQQQQSQVLGSCERSSPPFIGKDGLRDRLHCVLARTNLLRKLTIRVHAPHPWPGRTEIEDQLLSVREILEVKTVNLPHLIELRLMPIYALGILLLNWQGFSNLGSVFVTSNPGSPTSNLWTRLQKLTIQMHNAEYGFDSTKELTSAQTGLFFGALYHYLRALTPTLQQLTFIWLGHMPGPCPLALHLHPSLTRRKPPPLKWLTLTKLRVSNTSFLQQSIDLASQLAPNLELMQTRRMRSMPVQQSREHSGKEQAGGAWVDILPNKTADIRTVKAGEALVQLKQSFTTSLFPLPWSTRSRRRSSVYSLASDQYVDGPTLVLHENHEVQVDEPSSRSSCDVPIMLDVSPGSSEW